MTNLKALFAHIVITIISFYVLTYGYTIFSNDMSCLIYGIFHFCLIVLLYVLSGYIITNAAKKFKIFNYSAIAIVGLTIWLICIRISPNDLDWKKGNGGVWFYHQLYLAGIEEPFWFNDWFYLGNLKKKELQTLILLILSILPSILQALGGMMKRKLSRNLKENQILNNQL